MTEYISREELRKHLKECYDNELFDADMRKVTFGIDVYVENMPTADVQPVNQWISVDERLPENCNLVLVWYTKYTLFGAGEGYGISWYHRCNKWFKGTLEGDDICVKYWQPLPEPPKDGDTNGRT